MRQPKVYRPDQRAIRTGPLDPQRIEYARGSRVDDRLIRYDNYTAAQKIIEFVDALSNWYVRRSRDRFWSEDKRDPDKLDAYWTLYECLLTTAKIIAPFVPFIAEGMWQNLAGVVTRRDMAEKSATKPLALDFSPCLKASTSAIFPPAIRR